ncbi:sulfatase-like hydrolase/transferase [Streptomyces sp. NBC_00996]|uniref:sulfatase-like hydrolase/transferase n=1 Tax=Streptomyces sp. NBC_00996 TaxID=2903710 RepID=UPI00386C14F8|nr:sulfatase-like hydrolase/transferase [Streptomyces sp. NBC_00996]
MPEPPAPAPGAGETTAEATSREREAAPEATSGEPEAPVEATPGVTEAPAEAASNDTEATPGLPEAPAEATSTDTEATPETTPGDAETPAEAASNDTEATPGDGEDPAPASDGPEAPAETAPTATPGSAASPVHGRRRWRGWREKYPVAARTLAWTTTGLAAALVLFALLMPSKIDDFRPAEFARIPVEAIFGAAVLIVLPRKPRIAVAALAGLSLGALTVLNFLDIGFYEYLGRGFNVVLDWTLFGDAQAYLQDTMGKKGALGIVVVVVLIVLAVLALMTLSVVRLGNLLARYTERATRTTLVMAIVWVTCAALGVQFTGVPFASEHTTLVVQDRAERVRNTIRDEAAFAKIAKKDAFADTPPDQLLTGLRGKDMMITFIESYGRSAIEDPVMAPGVDATLTAENEKLTKAGFAAKSGWLTSATYGGSSWLGHSTFLSGLWINNQQRYRTVTAGDHLTLPGAFKKTGDWDTVGVMPGVQKAWPEQKFYGIDKLYDSRDLGYKGPKFSWSTMPDQYALTAFERLVHGKKHDKPLMSTIILTSSHQPWAPIPKTVPQDQVGNGSIYDAIQKAGKKPADIITDSTKSKQEYGKSIQYSVTSLIDYLVKYGNKDTVLVFLGDHQPIARVSGNNASRDVPVSIVAKDPKVLDKIADWGWTDGLQPQHDAPVWKMSAFRDRFLTVYGSTPRP